MLQLTKLKDEDGQAVLETAIVIPIILLLVMVGISLSLLLYTKIIVTMSASNGARVGSVIWHSDEYTEGERKETIKNASLSMVEENLAGDERRYLIEEIDGMLHITVEYDFRVVLPFSNVAFNNNIITVSHTAQYYIGKSD